MSVGTHRMRQIRGLRCRLRRARLTFWNLYEVVQFGMAGECEDSVDNEADCGGVCGRGDHTKLFFSSPMDNEDGGDQRLVAVLP